MMTVVNLNSVLVTGTTSGVGRALLEHYATSGVKVIAVNRRRVAELESRYPSVRFECVDVRSAQDVADLVRSLAASGQLPMLGSTVWTMMNRSTCPFTGKSSIRTFTVSSILSGR